MSATALFLIGLIVVALCVGFLWVTLKEFRILKASHEPEKPKEPWEVVKRNV